MARFFLVLFAAVALGAASILVRASDYASREAALARAQGQTAAQCKEGADMAFNNKLQEEWPFDVGVAVTVGTLVHLGLKRRLEHNQSLKSG